MKETPEMKPNEFSIWRVLAIVSAALAVLCIPFPPTRFGAAFFGALAIGCGGEAFAVRKAQASRAARGIARLGRVLFVLFLLSFLTVQGMILLGEQPDPEAESADYVLVLGAQIYPDRPSAALKARLDTAFAYLERNPEATAILCGGQGSNEVMPEAWMMRDYLLERGVEGTRLLVEDESSNTIENIANARRAFLSDGDRTAVISSDFHLARARKLMASAGLDPYGVPAPTPYLAVRMVSHLREYGSIVGLIISGRWF